MNKRYIEERIKAIELELAQAKAELAKPELPEGFTPFRATGVSVCPCHPSDVVSVCLLYALGEPNDTSLPASRFNWKASAGNTQIIGYKVTKKYVEPRPLKYSELPVGQVFMWGNPSESVPTIQSVYMKIHPTRNGDNAVVLKHGKDPTSKTGELTLFTDDYAKYYAVDSRFEKGAFLTSPAA